MCNAHITCDGGLSRDGNRLLFRTKGGRILYESNGRTYPFELELAVPGFFIYCPRKLVELSAEERETVLEGLRHWLAEVGYLPKQANIIDYSEEEEICLIAGCTFRRLKGRYLCREHFDSGSPDPASVSMIHFLPAPDAV